MGADIRRERTRYLCLAEVLRVRRVWRHPQRPPLCGQSVVWVTLFLVSSPMPEPFLSHSMRKGSPCLISRLSTVPLPRQSSCAKSWVAWDFKAKSSTDTSCLWPFSPPNLISRTTCGGGSKTRFTVAHGQIFDPPEIDSLHQLQQASPPWRQRCLCCHFGHAEPPLLKTSRKTGPACFVRVRS